MTSKRLDTPESISSTACLQIANIIVNIVMFVLQVAGVKVSVSKQDIAKRAEEIVPVINSVNQHLVEALEALEEGVKNHSPAHNIAKAIFDLIKEIHPLGILWKIIKGLCIHMSVEDWVTAAAVVTATIIAAIATDGAALIPKIVLALQFAFHEFISKINSLTQLKSMKAKHQ